MRREAVVLAAAASSPPKPGRRPLVMAVAVAAEAEVEAGTVAPRELQEVGPSRQAPRARPGWPAGAAAGTPTRAGWARS